MPTMCDYPQSVEEYSDTSFSDLHNFSGGPGALPQVVLQQAHEAIIKAPGTNISLLGVSHRSHWFQNVLDEAEFNIRTLLNVPSSYHILFLQGGGTMQFSMVPVNLLRGGNQCADYLTTGYWSKKALTEARKEGTIHEAWNGESDGFRRLPEPGECRFSSGAAYLHYISNETVEGLQFPYLPGLRGVRRVCDMSSDFLSKPFDISDYAVIYAHAQKNMGPAGVTIVIVHEDVLQDAPQNIPSIMDYRLFAQHRSNYNTPPVFAIYTMMLVTRWLQNDVGGLGNMSDINRRKAKTLYGAIDSSYGFYRGTACHAHRSQMNATFVLPTPDLTNLFLVSAEQAGFVGLTGHRSLGGIRASLYNGVTVQAVEDLVEFMDWFRLQHGTDDLAGVQNG